MLTDELEILRGFFGGSDIDIRCLSSTVLGIDGAVDHIIQLLAAESAGDGNGAEPESQWLQNIGAEIVQVFPLLFVWLIGNIVPDGDT